MAACSRRQFKYAIHQRLRTAAERLVHELPKKLRDEADVPEIMLITISFFVGAFDVSNKHWRCGALPLLEGMKI
jgi:hypothetical protein